jgi:hypothetical protein
MVSARHASSLRCSGEMREIGSNWVCMRHARGEWHLLGFSSVAGGKPLSYVHSGFPRAVPFRAGGCFSPTVSTSHALWGLRIAR